MKSLSTSHLIVLLAILYITFNIVACTKQGKLNVFSIEDDKRLGLQLSQEIANNAAQYPVMPIEQYPQAYSHLQRITDAILNSGKVQYRNDFNWKIHLIRDDKTLNAFCAPGGYIYVYTGIIKYLDNEAQLAGVMGHEIAHADLRHSTSRLTQAYGMQVLLDLLIGQDQGNSRLLAQIAAELVTLSYSRSNESEADAASVQYLCNTEYQSTGAAGFFEKLEKEGKSNRIDFLSTHPSPEKRVERIREKGLELKCDNGGTFTDRYQQFKQSLP